MNNAPLLASLGNTAKPAPAGLAGDTSVDSLTTDDRALDAALEFASLLLASGGQAPDGKTLPVAGGKTLPPVADGKNLAEGMDALPVAAVEIPLVELELADAQVVLPETPESIIAAILAPDAAVANDTDAAEIGRQIAGQIRRAQSAGTASAPAAVTGDPEAPTQPPAALVSDALAATARSRNSEKELIALSGVRDLATSLQAEPPAQAAAGRTPAPAPMSVQDSAALASRSLTLDVPMGDQEWGRQFSERVGWVIHARVPSAQLRLNPEHLGPIEMSIEVDEHNARVNFVAAHGMTREAIEQSLPRLREMLEQQGLTLQQADVSGGDSRTHDDGDRTFADDTAGAADSNRLADGDSSEAGQGKSRVRHAAGLIDTFV